MLALKKASSIILFFFVVNVADKFHFSPAANESPGTTFEDLH